MRGKFPYVPAQMGYFHSQDGMGKIEIQTAKGKKKGQKEVFWEWSQSPLFDPFFFLFCFLIYKCRYRRERPGVIQDPFMGLKRGYFYICKNRGKAAGPHSVPLYGHTASARRRAVEPVLLNRENGRWAKGGCLGPVPVGCCICRKKSPIVSLVHRGYDRGSSCSGQ